MKKFHKVLIVVLLIIGFITYMDIIGFKMWQLLGGFSGDNYCKANQAYLTLFWNFAYGLIAVSGIVYYIMRKDWSETIAIIIIPITLLWFGIEDWMYYKLQHIPLDASMPWLMNSFGTGNVAKTMGLNTVTPQSLTISIIVGIVVSYLLAIWLEKKKW